MAKLGDLVVRIGADTRDLNKSLGRVQRNMRSMTSNFTALGQSMTRSLTLPIAAFGAAALKSAADLEQLETSFVSLTGGASQAAAMMANLNEFTAATPFQIEAVANAARQLVASGTEVSKVNEQLQFLGDIAATSGSSIEEIAAIFAKVNAKGKVELENLNQLAERGIPIFKALADATGLPADALGAGAVSVEQFNQVLKGFAEEGGFAAGAMERLSKTTSGLASTALDNAKIAAASFGELFLPAVNKVLEKVIELSKAFTSLSPETKRVIAVVAVFAATLGPMLIVVGKFIPLLVAARAATIAFTASLATNPIGLAAIAISGLVAAVVGYSMEARTAARETWNWRDALAGVAGTARKIELQRLIEEQKQLIEFTESYIRVKEQEVAAGDDGSYAYRQAVIDLAQMRAGLRESKDTLASMVEELENLNTESRSAFVRVVNLTESMTTLAEILKYTKKQAKEAKIEIQEFDDAVDNVDDLDFTFDANKVIREFERARNAAKDFAYQVNQSIEFAVESMLMGVAQMVGASVALGEPLRGIGMMLGDILANLAMELGKYAIAHGVAIEAIKESLKSLNGPAAIAAGIALLAIGAGLKARMQKVASDAGIPALAEGGLAYGPTTALIGDNRNARIDPEVVAPLSKLKDMLGGNQVEVYGRISGRDILLANDRATRDRNRII